MELVRTIAALPPAVRGEPLVLGADPKGENFLYCHDKYVITRKIDDPKTSEIYAEHKCQVLVAKYSPTRNYIASGDKNGFIRIWDTINEEHVLKSEYQPLSGSIKDIDWDAESKRIVVAGDGRESYTAAFSFDTGTSLGEMRAHTKKANSVSFKPNRPYRIVSGAEDFDVAFYTGPPFKIDKTHHLTNFINSVRYSPNGELFAGAGASGIIMVYDGKSGDEVGQLGNPAHRGGIYGLSFSPDSKRLVSASADKTVKIWAVEDRENLPKEPLVMYCTGSATQDMQVSCLWAREDTIITVSVSGCINLFSPDALGDGPRTVLRGHNKPITCMALCPGAGTAHVMTGATDGQIAAWDLESGAATYVSGEGHTSQVQGLAMNSDGQAVSVGMDDTLRFTALADLRCGAAAARKLDSQPRAVDTHGDLTAILCLDKVLLLRKGADLATIPVDYDARCLKFSPDGAVLAIGGNVPGEDKYKGISADPTKKGKVYVHRVPAGAGDAASEIASVPTKGVVCGLAFSPDGARLAAVDDEKKTNLIGTAGWSLDTELSRHNGKVLCCAWSPDGQRLATSGLDTNINVWTLGARNQCATLQGAHPKTHVNAMVWLDNERLVSAGQDSMIRLWKLT